MADDEIMAVDKRRASLEVTVAEGFFEQGKKLDRLDASFESLRSDFTLFFERLDGLHEFMERSREEDRSDRAADRGQMNALLGDHNRRLRAIERLERRRAAQA